MQNDLSVFKLSLVIQRFLGDWKSKATVMCLASSFFLLTGGFVKAIVYRRVQTGCVWGTLVSGSSYSVSIPSHFLTQYSANSCLVFLIWTVPLNFGLWLTTIALQSLGISSKLVILLPLTKNKWSNFFLKPSSFVTCSKNSRNFYYPTSLVPSPNPRNFFISTVQNFALSMFYASGITMIIREGILATLCLYSDLLEVKVDLAIGVAVFGGSGISRCLLLPRILLDNFGLLLVVDGCHFSVLCDIRGLCADFVVWGIFQLSSSNFS